MSDLNTRTVIAEECVLYKQPRSKRWYCRIKLEQGGWERFATGQEDIKDAKKKALELWGTVRAKAEANLPQSTRSFSAVAKSVIQDLEEREGTDAWRAIYPDYIGVIQNYQIPFFKRIRLDNIKKHYKGYLSHIEKEMGRVPSSSTISTHHAALKLVLDSAVENGWLSHSGLPVLKNEGRASAQRPTFDISEYRSMRAKLEHWSKQGAHRAYDAECRSLLYDYVLILANSGIRHGEEARRIKWRHISFKKSRQGNELVVMRVLKKKGRKATEEWRDVVVRHNSISDAKKVLERLKNRVDSLRDIPLKKLVKSNSDQALFAISDGSVPTRLDNIFKRFLAEHDLSTGAEGTQRTLYSLRHFYATQELERKHPISIALLAKQMGTSIKMIEKYYGHLDTVKQGDELSGWTQF